MVTAMSRLAFAATVTFAGVAHGAASDTAYGANPIRKVVTMLQAMQTKVSEEGEKEKELYEKFMCYCKNSGGDLQASIQSAETKMPALSSDITSSEQAKLQNEETLKQSQIDRDAAKQAMQEATALREKEAAAFAKEKSELETNIAAIGKAVNALEKGMGGGFLQTSGARILRQVVTASKDMNEEDRSTVLAFLSATSETEYAPQSGQITGILKEMGDEMSKSLADATADETAAIQSYEGLMSAKTKEKEALTENIETKTAKIGELGVSIAQMKNDLTDTEEALIADQKFVNELEKNCKTKTGEWEERQKTRADELVALADTIKVLNDDDALDLFKSTLHRGESFVQMKSSESAVRSRALESVKKAIAAANKPARSSLDFIALALRGKKVGFDKVLKMIDNMVAALKKEQADDDHKKEYCAAQFDQADDSKKALERKVSDHETAAASADEGISSLAEEIKALEAGIKDLDKSVAEATEDRKAAHKENADLMASNSAAKELLKFAKNRLNKFYNPKLYKPPAKQELSREDRIAVNMGGEAPPTAAPGGIAGTGITVFAQVSSHTFRAAPPPPPETFGAYSKKSEESNGVMAMIDLLIKDLDKEITEAETQEKEDQSDYETMMSDSAEKRAADSKSLTGKQGAKADMEAELESHKENKAATGKELMATMSYIQSLHSECDWLVQYYDMRKEARSGESDSLKNAKAVLSGADYSFVQSHARNHLRGR